MYKSGKLKTAYFIDVVYIHLLPGYTIQIPKITTY